MYGFYEFFAGGGMARIGLGDQWKCLFANDASPKKAAVYKANFSDASSVLRVTDVANIKITDLPGEADLAWASFPCQDLSLAGNGAGLQGLRSGVFWPFWSLIRELESEHRSPKIVVLENVGGALTSHGGADFTAIVEALVNANYAVGALTIDAVQFVPQSRPRVFFIAVRNSVEVSPALLHGAHGPHALADRLWHSDRLFAAQAALPERLKVAWLWWKMKYPKPLQQRIDDLLEPDHAVKWHSDDATLRLMAMMSDIHMEKVSRAQRLGKTLRGTIYKRTRVGRQRAEVRFDGISGCLRTPEGGSSRQTILQVDGPALRSRLLTPREAARLMGLPDSYVLPANYNEAYHVAGDGLAVPVVAWMEQHLLNPLLEGKSCIQVPALTHPMNRELFLHV